MISLGHTSPVLSSQALAGSLWDHTEGSVSRQPPPLSHWVNSRAGVSSLSTSIATSVKWESNPCGWWKGMGWAVSGPVSVMPKPAQRREDNPAAYLFELRGSSLQAALHSCVCTCVRWSVFPGKNLVAGIGCSRRVMNHHPHTHTHRH